MAARVTVCGKLKGGVGKSRLAKMIAFYLAVVEGKKTHLIDADSVSQTAWDWKIDFERAAKGKRKYPITVSRHPFEDISDHVRELEGEKDEIVIDVGGGNVNVFSAALERANRLFIPVGADPSEVRRLPATWKAATAAAAMSEVGGLAAWVVLSRSDHQTTLPGTYRDLLTSGEEGAFVYPVMKAEMVKRVAYQRAYGQVPTISDFRRLYPDVGQVLEEAGMIEKSVVAV
ncbi:ParA family protein [Streptomyces olivoreticuli]|uniref:ParA family protein n=1 Tax=Streptomyces longwoodensis TaxID=68231 RepID=UPI0034004AF5